MYTQLELIKTLSNLTQQAEMRKLVSLFFFFFFFFVSAAHLCPLWSQWQNICLAGPLSDGPAGECMRQREWKKSIEDMCVCVCRVCWDVEPCSCWGSPPDGCPLFPSLCVSGSLSLSLSRPVYGPSPSFSAHTATKFMSLDTSLSQGIN